MPRLALIAALLVPTAALAADKSNVAVLDIQGTGVEPSLLPTLTEVLTVEIDTLGTYNVIGGRDVQAMLGFEQQKDVLGCTDAACLAEIGGALGVDRIVASHIGKVGATYVVNIKLINIRMAKTEARVYETVRGEQDALLLTIRKSVTKLLGAGSSETAQKGAAGGGDAQESGATRAAAAADDQEQPEQVAMTPAGATAEAQVRSGGSRLGWLPITLWGAGALCVGGGVVLGLGARDNEATANERAPESTEARVIYADGAQRASDNARQLATFANVLFGVGGAAIAGGLLAFLLGGPDDDAVEAGTSVTPVAGAHGAGVVIMGHF